MYRTSYTFLVQIKNTEVWMVHGCSHENDHDHVTFHEICEWAKEEKDHRNTEGRLRMSHLFEHITKTPFQNHFLKHHKYCPNLVCKKTIGTSTVKYFSVLPAKVFLKDVGVLQTFKTNQKIIFRFGISINTGWWVSWVAKDIIVLRYYSIIITDQFGIKHRANKGPWCWTLLPLAPHTL